MLLKNKNELRVRAIRHNTLADAVLSDKRVAAEFFLSLSLVTKNKKVKNLCGELFHFINAMSKDEKL